MDPHVIAWSTTVLAVICWFTFAVLRQRGLYHLAKSFINRSEVAALVSLVIWVMIAKSEQDGVIATANLLLLITSWIVSTIVDDVDYKHNSTQSATTDQKEEG